MLRVEALALIFISGALLLNDLRSKYIFFGMILPIRMAVSLLRGEESCIFLLGRTLLLERGERVDS